MAKKPASNGAITIEHKVPLPMDRQGRRNTYPWAEMEIGDSLGTDNRVIRQHSERWRFPNTVASDARDLLRKALGLPAHSNFLSDELVEAGCDNTGRALAVIEKAIASLEPERHANVAQPLAEVINQFCPKVSHE